VARSREEERAVAHQKPCRVDEHNGPQQVAHRTDSHLSLRLLVALNPTTNNNRGHKQPEPSKKTRRARRQGCGSVTWTVPSMRGEAKVLHFHPPSCCAAPILGIVAKVWVREWPSARGSEGEQSATILVRARKIATRRRKRGWGNPRDQGQCAPMQSQNFTLRFPHVAQTTNVLALTARGHRERAKAPILSCQSPEVRQTCRGEILVTLVLCLAPKLRVLVEFVALPACPNGSIGRNARLGRSRPTQTLDCSPVADCVLEFAALHTVPLSASAILWSCPVCLRLPALACANAAGSILQSRYRKQLLFVSWLVPGVENRQSSPPHMTSLTASPLAFPNLSESAAARAWRPSSSHCTTVGIPFARVAPLPTLGSRRASSRI